jgi:hypothetical protein
MLGRTEYVHYKVLAVTLRLKDSVLHLSVMTKVYACYYGQRREVKTRQWRTSMTSLHYPDPYECLITIYFLRSEMKYSYENLIQFQSLEAAPWWNHDFFVKHMKTVCFCKGILCGNFDLTRIPRLSQPSTYNMFESVYSIYKTLGFHALKAKPGEVK